MDLHLGRMWEEPGGSKTFRTSDHGRSIRGTLQASPSVPRRQELLEPIKTPQRVQGDIGMEPESVPDACPVGLPQERNGTLTLPDGTAYSEGDDCDGEPGRLALYQWPPQAGENTDPRIITSDIAGTRFTEDGQIYVLAFAPRGAEVPLPPSTSNLDDPDDTEPEVVEPVESASTTTPEGGDVPTTTAAAEPTTTTVGG